MRFFAPWEEMKVGDFVTFCRTFTEGDVANFVGLTGDFNPFHIDTQSAIRCGFKKMVVPGLLTASMIAHAGGTLMPEPYAASRVSIRFSLPVYVGESICAHVTVAKKDLAKNKLMLQFTCTNQQTEVVLEGEVSGKVIPIYSKKVKE